jgi:hypothetical protein
MRASRRVHGQYAHCASFETRHVRCVSSNSKCNRTSAQGQGVAMTKQFHTHLSDTDRETVSLGLTHGQSLRAMPECSGEPPARCFFAERDSQTASFESGRSSGYHVHPAPGISRAVSSSISWGNNKGSRVFVCATRHHQHTKNIPDPFFWPAASVTALPDAAAAFVFSAGVDWLQPNSPTTASNPTTNRTAPLDFLIAISSALFTVE